MSDVVPDSPFGVPEYRSLWSANLISHLGFVVQTVAAAWLMTELDPSPKMVALVQTSNTLPIMLLALLAGAIADSFDRRKVMLLSMTLMLLASLLLSVLTAMGQMTPWLLLGFTFLIACGLALRNPAWQATVGEIVPKPMLATAITYNSIAFNTARSGGPAIGGALVAAAGSAWAFALSCVSYLSLAFALYRWDPKKEASDLPPERIGPALSSGMRYFAMSPQLLRLFVRAMLFAFASSAISALMPVIVRDLIGGGALMYGLLLGAFGVGAVCGAFVTVRLRKSVSDERIMMLASLALIFGAVTTAHSQMLWLTLPALFLAGLGWVTGTSILNAMIQLATPRWVVARVIAIQQTGTFGGMALGGVFYGFLADGAGISTALLVCGAAQVIVILLGAFVRLPNLDDVDLEPAGLRSFPQPVIPMTERSGPISISLRYRVDEANSEAFLKEMRHWRRIRRRDGARRWKLLRDLSDKQVWIERYQVATWFDYARHNSRRTHSDTVARDRILSLLLDDELPEIRRFVEIDPGNPGSDPKSPALIFDGNWQD